MDTNVPAITAMSSTGSGTGNFLPIWGWKMYKANQIQISVVPMSENLLIYSYQNTSDTVLSWRIISARSKLKGNDRMVCETSILKQQRKKPDWMMQHLRQYGIVWTDDDDNNDGDDEVAMAVSILSWHFLEKQWKN